MWAPFSLTECFDESEYLLFMLNMSHRETLYLVATILICNFFVKSILWLTIPSTCQWFSWKENSRSSLLVPEKDGRYSRLDQWALVVRKLPADTGDIRDVGSIPGLGSSRGGGHSNPLLYSCLEHPTDRGVWWAAAHRIAKSWTQLKRT